MDEMNLDRSIRDALHICADGLSAPETLKTRVGFALNSAPKRRSWSLRGRIAVACCAVMAVAVVGAVAGGLGSITTHSDNSQRLNYAQTLSHAQDISDKAALPETLAGGFSFTYGSELQSEAEQDGKTEHRTEVDASYEKDGVQLSLNIHEPYTVFDGVEAAQTGERETKTVGGLELTFGRSDYMFVPPDYQPTDEENRLRNEGKLVISYGTDEIERQQFQSVAWEKDGLNYMLFGFDTGLDAQSMFDMAAEIIGA